MVLCTKGELAHIQPKRILVCQLRQIGDVLLATPSIRMLKAKWPEAEIDILTEKKCTPVLENNPDISNIQVIDKSLNLFESLRFYHSVGGSGYDLIIDFQQLPRCKWVIMFARNCIKMTFPPNWYNRIFYTHWAPLAKSYAAKSKTGILSPFGLEYAGEPPRIYLSEKEKRWAKSFKASLDISDDQKLILVDPTHRRKTRRWPAKYYAEFISKALENDESLRFLLLYGPGELELVKQLHKMIGNDPRVIIPKDMLSLREMAAIIAEGEALVGNCSAPRHFAVAVSTKSLVINGATSASAWRYRTTAHVAISLKHIVECQPCNKNECSHCRCLTEIYPDMVLKSFWELLALNPEDVKPTHPGYPASL